MNTLPSLPARANGPPAVTNESDAMVPEFLAPGISLAQVFAIAGAYWRMTTIVTLSLIALVICGLMLMPRTYTAIATLMVNYELNQGGKEAPIGAVGSYMSTQVEFIMSDRVLLPVVRELNLTEDKEFTAHFSGHDPTARDVWVLNNLRESLSVTQGRGSQLIYIQVDVSNPQKAARIANAIAQSYLVEERRLVSEPAAQRAADYSKQLTELQAKVTAAQENVTRFRRRNGLNNVARDDADALALNTLEQQLLAAQNARRATEARGVGERGIGTDVLDSPALQEIRRQLAGEELQLAQARTTFGPRHPKIHELQSQMAVTRAALTHALGVYGSSKSTDIAAGRELEESLTHAIEEGRVKVAAVRQLQDEGTKLLLQLESAQAVYKRALDGYDEIMFASGGKPTNVSLMSWAMPAVTPSKPKTLKYGLAGVLGSVLIGLLTPLIYELWFNRRVRCRDDLERHFGMPVLAELTHRDGLVPRR